MMKQTLIALSAAAVALSAAPSFAKGVNRSAGCNGNQT